MIVRWSVVVLALAGLAGCAAMERYHKPVGLENVPTGVLVSLSRTYPNITVTSIEQQAMYDGVMRYAVAGQDAHKKDVLVVFKADGTEIK
ncbi:MAG: hypothetical protein WCI73_01600 [Phycisphaerae bacterium]